jgi:hypothetical protein
MSARHATLPRDDRAPRRPPAMIVHVAFEVSELTRSARFYDAIFYALGARRMFESDGARGLVDLAGSSGRLG